MLPFTWALGKPDAFARRIARNTHLVLQEESSLGRVFDPAHGAWFIEKITDELAQKSWALFQDIEAKGGMGAALESGFIQGEIARTAEARARGIATGHQELTGVSAFPRLADDGVKVAPHPPAEPVVKGGTSVAPLAPRRLAEPFEQLRDAADAHLASTGKRPQVFLACLGDLAAYSGPRDLDQELPRRRRHRGRCRRQPSQLGRRGQGLRRERGAPRLHLLLGRRLRRAGRGDRGRAEGCRSRARCCLPAGPRRRKPRSRRPASTHSFLLVATRSQPLRVSMMH